MKTTAQIFTAIAIIASFTGCNKNYVSIGEHPFEITFSKIESGRIMADIIPDNNDFHYMFGMIDTSTMNSFTDEEFVKLLDDTGKELYRNLNGTDDASGYSELLYREAISESFSVIPDTWYYAYAFPYEDNEPMSEKMTKVLVKSLPATKSDIHFDVKLDGSLITVTPTNDDRYFYEYCSTKDLQEYYAGRPTLFYSMIIDLYWEYGFIDNMLLKGEPHTEDITDFYEPAAGDEFVLVASGYDNGVSSNPEVFNLKYKGQELPGEVTSVVTGPSDKVSDSFALPSSLKDILKSNIH